MKDNVKATVVNTYLYGDIEKDYNNLISAIKNKADSDIIVFSEVCLSNFQDEKQHDMIIKEIAHISKNENIIIIVGFDDVIDNKKYNSAYLFEDGNYEVYNKVHLVFDEVGDYVSGNSFPVLDTKIGKIGMMICYDAIFPESARCLRLKGAEIICLLAQWIKSENEYWDYLLKVRAKENWVYLIASDDMNKGCGKSMIIGPDGKILCTTNKSLPYDTNTIILDGNKLDELNDTDPTVNWPKIRQPEKYEIISKN
ncbi:MAG: carbon-nitrogen hydrolase family protein [Candidatus Woesearchaeota archaeon]